MLVITILISAHESSSKGLLFTIGQTVEELWNMSLPEWRRNCPACFVSLVYLYYEAFAADPFISEYLMFLLSFWLSVFLQLSSVPLFLFLCLLKSVKFYFLPHSCCLILSLFPHPYCCRSWEFCCCVCVYFLFTSVLLFCICEICSRCSYNSI